MTFPTPEHVKAAQDAARYWQDKVGVYVWPSISLAQACIESANWTRLSGKNNGFGIKATQAQRDAGQASIVWTREVVNGQSARVQQWFADYSSLTDAYIAHAKLLATSGYYVASRHANNPRQYVVDIAPHYATDPNYARAILRTMDVLNLTQYDAMAESARVSVPPLQPPREMQKAPIPPAAGAGAVVIAGTVAAAASHGAAWGHGAFLAAFLVGLVALLLAGWRFEKAYMARDAITSPTPPAPPAIPPVSK